MASIVVAICDHLLIYVFDESSMRGDAQSYSHLRDRSAVAVQSSLQSRSRIVARQREQQVADLVSGDAGLEERVIDSVGKLRIAQLQKTLGDELERVRRWKT